MCLVTCLSLLIWEPMGMDREPIIIDTILSDPMSHKLLFPSRNRVDTLFQEPAWKEVFAKLH